MSEERRSLRKLLATGALAVLLLMLLIVPVIQAQGGIPRTPIQWAVIKKLTVQGGGATFQSDVTLSGSTTDLTVGGDLTVAGDATLTGDGSFDDLLVTDTLDVNGDIDLDGDGFDINITGGASIDADLASNFSTSAGDITVETETGSLVLKGDEAVADAVYLDANDAVTSGVTIAVGSVSGLSIGGGLTDVGGGSYATADGDNDLGVAGDLEVDGATDLDGTLAVAGAATLASDLTISSDSTGGNAGARTQIIGMPAIKLVALGTMTNGSTESANYLDDSPAGEWSEIDAGTNLVVTADSSVYRVGTTSLKLDFTTPVTDDGVTGTAGAQDDLSGNESIGFWMYSDEAITAGDISLTVDDSDGTDQVYTSTIAAAANTWTWIEVDISGCDANCDTMDNIIFLVTGQGAANLSDPAIYFDGMWKWDADDEEALGVNLVQDGVLSVLTITTAQDQANTPAALTEQTNYVVNYQSGNDVIVTVDDQSANSGVALVAYQ